MNSLKRAVELMGGNTAVAERLGIAKQNISNWLGSTRPIPVKHCIEIEKATAGRVTCEELCPSIDWNYLRNSRKRKSA